MGVSEGPVPHSASAYPPDCSCDAPFHVRHLASVSRRRADDIRLLLLTIWVRRSDDITAFAIAADGFGYLAGWEGRVATGVEDAGEISRHLATLLL